MTEFCGRFTTKTRSEGHESWYWIEPWEGCSLQIPGEKHRKTRPPWFWVRTCQPIVRLESWGKRNRLWMVANSCTSWKRWFIHVYPIIYRVSTILLIVYRISQPPSGSKHQVWSTLDVIDVISVVLLKSSSSKSDLVLKPKNGLGDLPF